MLNNTAVTPAEKLAENKSTDMKQSLNDMLMKGTDLYNSLVGVLYKFRQGEYAVVVDIMEMFHMVKIKSEDR